MATVVDKTLLQTLRPEIDVALAVIAKRYGLAKLHCGNASFDPRAGSFTFKVEGVAEGALGKAAALYTSPDAAFLGLPPLGTAFETAGRKYKTAGLNTVGSKVICDRDDGKSFLFPVLSIKRLCGVAVTS